MNKIGVLAMTITRPLVSLASPYGLRLHINAPGPSTLLAPVLCIAVCREYVRWARRSHRSDKSIFFAHDVQLRGRKTWWGTYPGCPVVPLYVCSDLEDARNEERRGVATVSMDARIDAKLVILRKVEVVEIILLCPAGCREWAPSGCKWNNWPIRLPYALELCWQKTSFVICAFGTHGAWTVIHTRSYSVYDVWVPMTTWLVTSQGYYQRRWIG